MLPDLHVTRTGDGPPIVVLHGGGPGCAATTDFAAVIPTLERVGTVFAIDLDNYGCSPSADISGPAATHHAARVASTLDGIAVNDAVFVCQSLGGVTALRLAAERPDLVSRLIITGAQPLPDTVAASDWTLGPRVRNEFFAGRGPSEDGMRRLLSATEWRDPAQIPGDHVRIRYRTAVQRDALETTYSLSRGLPEDLTDLLPRVAPPVLLIWGEHDPFAPPTYAAEIAARLPRAQLRLIAGTAHHPQTERPAEYLRHALSFVIDGTTIPLASQEISHA